MKSLVRLDQITKRFGSICALDDVSLEIGPGVTGLLGPNGAGKSTLIKLLLGLVRTTSGTGQVLGYDLARDSRTIRANVGYMPEDDCYIAGLIGVEMLRFQARLAGLPSVEGLRRAHEILDFCGMGSERYRPVEKYSTGMRQKLKFAQAIVHDPPLLILDEPTSGLDPEERVAMLSRVRVLSEKEGKAVIISTHILPDVQKVCDRVVIVVKGRVRLSEQLAVLNRPSSPAYQLRVLGAADRLAARIRSEGVEVTESADGSLSIDGSDANITERIWQWARETNAGIRSLTPARNSLEQIFMDAVREESHANS